MTQVEWGAGVLDATVCPCCGDSRLKHVVLRVSEWDTTNTLVRCDTCCVRFFPELEPARYALQDDHAGARGLELAFGLFGSIEALARIDLAPGLRLLDGGCGSGYVLDFARYAFDARVLGIDDGAWSRVAADALDLEIVHALLGGNDAVEQGAWDVVVSCEVLEHVADPQVFLAAIREALAPGGTVLLQTPNAADLHPGRDPAVVRTILSPGFHTMLHTVASLERLLRAAGFDDIHVQAEGDTLRAAASDRILAWHPIAVLPPALVAEYLDRRAVTLAADSPARVGLLQRGAEAALMRGDLAGARRVLDDLDGALRVRHGVGLDAGAASLPAGKAAAPYCYALSSVADLAQRDGDAERARMALGVAAEAGERALVAFDVLGASEQGLEQIANRARLRSVVADGDTPGLRRLLAELGDAQEQVLDEALVAAVVGGAPKIAEEVVRTAEEGVAAGRPDPLRSAGARWALGMHELFRRERPAVAADRFAEVLRHGRVDPGLRWSACFHAAWALRDAGDADGCARLVQELIAAGDAAGGPDPALVERGRGLLGVTP